MFTLLTKSGGLLGPIASILGLIMNAIYEFFYMFGIENIALSIIVFTFIVRTLMLPLTIKQQKFSKLSSRMNPEIQKIQAKYKGKKDEASLRKQQEETQVIYQKYGANPTSGCLPLLITLPVMFALYSVINNIPAYVGQVKELYETVALAIMQVPDHKDVLVKLAEGLTRAKITDFTNTDQIIDILSKFGSDRWTSMMNEGSFSGIKETIYTSYNGIDNTLVGIKQVSKIFEITASNGNVLQMNITDVPGWKFPGIIIPILAMALQFVQGKQLEIKNKGNNQDPTANAMKSMNIVMPIMSGFFCITLPIGIGIYWIASSVYAIIQQFFVNKYMDKIDVDELIEKNIAKASKRKSVATTANGSSLQELARKQTKSIESSVTEKTVSTKNTDNDSNGEETSESSSNTQSNSNPKSISDIANLLKNRNTEKGDK